MVEDLDAVAHDGHLVEGGLAVEDDDVVVAEVPFDDEARRESEVVQVLDVAEVDPTAVGVLDVACAGPLVRPVPDEFHQLGDVVAADSLRNGQRLGDGSRDADLVDRQVRVRRNDGPRREVDALPHEVPSKAAFLALQALADGLERLARTLGLLYARLGAGVVVEDRVHLVLQEFLELLDDVGRFAVLHVLAEGPVRLDDGDVLVREVVLAPRVAVGELHRRTHVGRGHREDRH
mmetsp:Transcript_34337/g.110270  ORF Transcript_34337/g.110270 Transcript_34337/m.110270 type:complete len:234 (+) Transcript_34337:630-1331(+)